jgi:hypothetical protein
MPDYVKRLCLCRTALHPKDYDQHVQGCVIGQRIAQHDEEMRIARATFDSGRTDRAYRETEDRGCECKSAFKNDHSRSYGYCRHRNLIFARCDCGTMHEGAISATEWQALVKHLHAQALTVQLNPIMVAVAPLIAANHPYYTGSTLAQGKPPEFFQRIRTGKRGQPALSPFETRMKDRAWAYKQFIKNRTANEKKAQARRAATKPIEKVGERQQRRRKADREPTAITFQLLCPNPRNRRLA